MSELITCIKNYVTDGETFTKGNDYMIIEDCGDRSIYVMSNEGNKTWLDLEQNENLSEHFLMK